jgi:2-oxoisovalerate dehydrogenase E1 component alpha subunit
MAQCSASSRRISLRAWGRSDEQHTALHQDLEAQVAAALKEAQQHGSLLDGHLPPLETMFEDVYKDMPAHLREQLGQAKQ